MKTVLSTIVMLFLLCLTTAGQNKQAEVAKIRKAYATAKAYAEKAKKGTDPVLGHMEVTSSHVEPGVGPQKETLQYFFRRTEDQTTGMFRYKPFLITRKYNIAAQDFYEEFLFIDSDDGLNFFFKKGGDNETRYYYWSWNGAGSHSVIKGEPLMDEVFALRLSSDLAEAFARLMNRDY